MRNKTSQGRPPLRQVYARIREQYIWFDRLKVNRHVPGVKELDKIAWATWKPILADLKKLKGCQEKLNAEFKKLSTTHQLILPLGWKEDV